MANKVTAQYTLSSGSFIRAKDDSENLTKGRMYRVKQVKSESKYVVLDTDFCMTTSLKHKTIAFSRTFTLMSEDEVKAEFKILLKGKGFVNGQEFLDVRNSDPIKVDEQSRTHILAKFGKFMGVKIAGGHVWFAGKQWATPMVDLTTLPDAVPETKPSTSSNEKYYVHTKSKSEARQVANLHARGDASWLNYWDVYEENTVYIIQEPEKILTAYTSIEWASEDGTGIPIISFEEWQKRNGLATAETKTKKTVSLTGGSIEDQILAVVDEHLDSPEARDYMANSVEKLLNKWGIDKNVRTLEVKINGKKAVKVGKQHFKYDLVLKCMIARTNVALVGGAGSGKTTVVANCADALKLKFYSKSVSAQTGAHEFFGYQDANGNYVRTLFREAYENGGVFLLDEFDAGNPNVLAALNQATANEHCAFADDMITKHKDFICVMAGNTYGHGANSEYVGRNKIDAATLDRFAFIDFPYDEDLEHALADNKDWCKKVQAFRKKVEIKKIRTIISPRATIIGCQLLNSGVSEKDVMELVIFKGLNQEERNLLK